jgi:phage terminase large subunit-like protein
LSGAVLPPGASQAEELAALPADERAERIARLGDEEIAGLEYQWLIWARTAQLPPVTAWRVWLILAGRGFGKTRAGAEWVRARAEADGRLRIALVGATMAEARSVMIEGESGLLAIAPPWLRPTWEPSLRRLR